MAKINITMDDELLEKAEQFAKKMYMTKSGLISTALTQYIAQNSMMSAITDLSITMRKIADEGVIDEQSRKELEDFERFVQLITARK